jgi:thymidylate synthase
MFYSSEEGYLQLLKDTLQDGEKRETRNGIVISRFGCMMNFKNIGQYFPLLTTKKMFFRGIVEELLWFLRGSTNAKDLQEKGVHIWDGNSSREYLDSIGKQGYAEGELGPVYGWQWRKFGKDYHNANNDSKCVDQIKYVIEELQKDNNSRRAVLSAWNPVDLNKMALPPCHILYVFYKNKDGLSCHMTMRSSDLFLGLPFNIASTALLTHIIAKVLHMKPNEVSLSLCDAHIYEEHVEKVNIQLEKELYNLPSLHINKQPPSLGSHIEDKIRWIEELEYDDFVLENYKSHEAIKAIMK